MVLRRAIGAVAIALAALVPAFAQTASRESVAAVRQRTSWTPSKELVQVRAIASTLGELMDGTRDAELVRVEGVFLDSERGRDEQTLVIQDGDMIFNAHVLLDQAARLPAGRRPGQRVQLTGICSVIVDSESVPRSFRLQLRDASDVTVVAAGAVYRTGRIKEQTIRRQLARESALKARFDDLFERSSKIMIVHDRRGRVSTLNRAGEQATGYSREELRMLDPNWIFGSDYLDAIARMIEEGADSTPRAFRSELVPRKGARIPIDVHARVLVGDGQVVGVTSIARDLSERDRLENELRQAQKIEAVGRLATGIAHDFNNLITVLLGYSDELIEQVPPGSEWQRSATEIRRAAEPASGLTQQLLAFSRPKRRWPTRSTSTWWSRTWRTWSGDCWAPRFAWSSRSIPAWRTSVPTGRRSARC